MFQPACLCPNSCENSGARQMKKTDKETNMWRSGTAERCIREASTRASVYVDCVLREVGEIVEPRDTLRRIIMSKNEVFTKRDGGLTLIGVEAMVCKILQVLQLEVLAETVHEWVEGKQGDGGATMSRQF